jgi:hypothetical protein
MSVTDTAGAPAAIRRPGILGRTNGVFALFSRKIAAALDRLATTPREVPPEVFRFPLF